MRITNLLAVLSLATISVSACGLPAHADEMSSTINWRRLRLSPHQSQNIQVLEQKWNHEYMEIQPTIVDDQRKLTQLLADPKSDPLEIMSLQQAIARKREQLRSTATANYLRKRKILNENQQHSLEEMIRQAVAERQKMMNPGAQTDVMPDRIQMLMKRVRNIWPQAE